MPHDGTGDGWDISLPTDSGLISDTGQEIRDLRAGIAIRMDKEHNPLDVDSAGGEHKAGSAVAYYEASYPTQRPNGTSDLSAADAGRLLVRSDDGSVWYCDATPAWQRTKVVHADAIADGIITKEKIASGFTSGILPYAVFEEQTADGVDGGDFTNGAWRTRELTTEALDAGAIAALSSGSFILDTGKYRIRAMAAAYKVGEHRVALYDVTNTTYRAYGTSAVAPTDSSVQTYSELVHEITVSADDTEFELRHRCTTTNAGDGKGHAAGFGVEEIYARVEIWKLL